MKLARLRQMCVSLGVFVCYLSASGVCLVEGTPVCFVRARKGCD